MVSMCRHGIHARHYDYEDTRRTDGSLEIHAVMRAFMAQNKGEMKQGRGRRTKDCNNWADFLEVASTCQHPRLEVKLNNPFHGGGVEPGMQGAFGIENITRIRSCSGASVTAQSVDEESSAVPVTHLDFSEVHHITFKSNSQLASEILHRPLSQAHLPGDQYCCTLATQSEIRYCRTISGNNIITFITLPFFADLSPPVTKDFR